MSLTVDILQYSCPFTVCKSVFVSDSICNICFGVFETSRRHEQSQSLRTKSLVFHNAQIPDENFSLVMIQIMTVMLMIQLQACRFQLLLIGLLS